MSRVTSFPKFSWTECGMNGTFWRARSCSHRRDGVLVMPEIVKFEMPRVETVVQGAGAVREIGTELDRRGLRRVFLITGRSVGSGDAFAQLTADLGDRVVGTFKQIQAHNPVEGIVELIKAAREADADVFVAVGGGSPVDAAKLAAIGLAEGSASVEDLARNYLVFEYPNTIRQRPLTGKPMPVFAVPTTLSAAEWDGFAGSVDHARDTKDLTVYLEATPQVVFLDPEFCAHTPRELWATTGVRALDHAVETAYAKNAHPFTTALANGALTLLAENLPKSVQDPHDYEAALKCQEAAWMSIIGVHNVSLGLSHAIGHQLGAVGIPHGVTSCIMLPHVMRFLEPATSAEQARMAESLARVQGDGESVPAADRLERLLDELKVPRRVSDFGVGRDKMEGVARAALGDIVVRESPRPVDESVIFALLEKVW
ncbi:iron-containing alcohol dehydrogenase [Rhodococcus rhodochrous]|nr:iron-containing alcohol dehydrogenase [Rhodococcus rhodochrous]